MLRAKENVQNEHMRDLLEEVEDQLSNSLKELNQKSQEAQRYKVRRPNQRLGPQWDQTKKFAHFKFIFRQCLKHQM